MDAVNNTEVRINPELEAEADSISVKKEEENVKQFPYFEVKLSKEYKNGSETVEKIDLSGLEKLTTLDMQDVDAVMERMGRSPKNKIKDTLYCKHIAMHATGYPVEFFNSLSMKDMNEVVSSVYLYFLLS